jgi:hypothetical protein
MVLTATEATAPESLREFGAVLAAFRGEPVPYRFSSWEEALTQVPEGSTRRGPPVVVVDEFPYLPAQWSAARRRTGGSSLRTIRRPALYHFVLAAFADGN